MPPTALSLFPYTTLFRSNPATASRIGFLSVKGAEEISIKENYLFTNNYMDLVVINIADFTNPVLVNRNKDAFNSDRKSTRLNSSHGYISYAVFCSKKTTI